MTTTHVSRPGVHPHEHDGITLPDPPPPYSPAAAAAPYRHPRTHFGSSFLRPHSRKSSSSSPDSAQRTPQLFAGDAAPPTTVIQTPAELALWMATGPLAGPPSPVLPGSPTTPSRPRPTFNVGSPRDDRRHSRGWMNGGNAHDQSTNGRGSASGSTDSSESTDDDEDMQLPRLRHNHNHPNNGHIHVSHNGHTHTVDPHHPPAHDKLWHERSAAFDRVAARVESPPRVRDGSAGVHWRERIEPEPSAESKRDSGFFEETESPVKRRPTPTIDLSGLRLAGEPVTATKDEDKKTEGAAVPFPTPDVKTTAELAPAQGSVPFPTGSPTTSGPPSPGLLPRTPSTPIILSNGKPLKPSLKSSSSSPSIANLPLHARSRSAPSTPGNLLLSTSAPGTPKNVHFPTRAEELQSVRLFRPAGRPTAVSLDRGAEDTETETEGYDSSAVGGYPFPVSPPQPAQDSIIVINTGLTSPVPAPSATHPHHGGGQMYSNVHLETLTLPKTRPYTLVGSVLVRNVAYHKQVAIRFTLDDWQTTSEVTSHYVASVPQLPPPFFESRSSPLVGDALTSLSHASVGWDRFAWQIKLEDVTERRLIEKTLYLVVRYTANGDGGGEWWDNNSGANYRVVFKKEATPVKTGAPSPASAASRALAHAIRAENRSGGLPPLQLRNKRPSLTQSLSFGHVPRAVSAGGRPSSPTIDTSVPAAGTNSPPKAPHSPVSPVRGLSLKNYIAPNKTPPPIAQPLPIVVQQPSPPRSPVRTGSPVPELTTREIVLDGGQSVSVPVPLGANGSSFAAALAASVKASSPVPSPSPSPPPMTLGPSTSPNGPTSASAPPPVWRSGSNGTRNGMPQLTLATRGQIDFSRGAFGGSEDNSPNGVDASPSPFPNDGHSIAGPMSPIGSPATNASYEALVKQWCFGGSPSMYTPSNEPRYGAPAGGFADQSYHAGAHSFGTNGPVGRAGHINGRVHGKSASEPEWFRQASSPGMLVGVGEMA